MDYKIYLSQPHLNGTEMDYIKKAFETNHLTYFGENIDDFQREISRYVGASDALATCSGTCGLHLALINAGVNAGDYVFCSSLTFAASANPIMYQGATPIFIDSEPDTWNMSPIALEKAFEWAKANNKLPKAVVVVDLYGQSADYDKILPLCKRYGAIVIEDSTEALGAKYNGKHCGMLGDVGVFSFTSNKIITTSGGGMIVSEDVESIKKMRYLASQAREPLPYYQHTKVGYNYRLSNVSAGIGLGQLTTLELRVKQKQHIFDKYKSELKECPLTMMPIKFESNYWLSCFTLDDETIDVMDIIECLEANKIEARMIWKPMHLQPIYDGYLYFMHNDDVSRNIFERGLCLPSATIMTDEEQNEVIGILKQFFNEKHQR